MAACTAAAVPTAHLPAGRAVPPRAAMRAAQRLQQRCPPTPRQLRKRPAPAAALLGGLFGSKAGGGAAQKREQLKEELLGELQGLKRGAAATDEDKARVDAAASALERINPTKKPLASPLTSGKWELLYTTSESILGLSKPPPLRPSGPIYQTLDVANLKASNQETAPFFNQVFAELEPESSVKVKVQFKKFKIFGLIPVTAPESARGELTLTYVDEDIRISRGNKGNLFVLKMVDPDATAW